MWFSVLLVLMSVSVWFVPSMCLDDIKLGLGSSVAIALERAPFSVNHMFSLYYVFFLFLLLPISVLRAGLWF